uniref:Uncharacterized protein n=1 Tax=Siphoviridae sp. ctWWc42 TaxID=2826361 RepID=A0A8S5R1K8_9CAUD|nr:MAG TPA: hypothetical protein [Siphoviridae sp. ctWWc42]
MDKILALAIFGGTLSAICVTLVLVMLIEKKK